MKWFPSLFAPLAVQFALASNILEKRASPNDVATIGYATLNGGTSGGSGGTTITVTTLDALVSAVSGTGKKIVLISGAIAGNTTIPVGSNTSVLGKSGSSLLGVGLVIRDSTNVIIRNVKISKVLTAAGDAIGIINSTQIWLDHLDLSSDRDHDNAYYDGLLDITHGSSGVTASYNKLSNHWKASLVGHSSSNGAEDTKITVTYVYNYWSNLNSRTPHVRFAHVHIYNNVFENGGIGCSDGAYLLVENNSGTSTTLPTPTDCFIIARGNDFGNTFPIGNFPLVYLYPLIPASSIRATVIDSAGQTLSF